MNLSQAQIDATELWMIRHGETTGNRARVFQDTHTPLSERGHHQAQRLAARLDGQAFSRIISSTAIRAIDTARYVSDVLGLEIHKDDKLGERDFGVWVGLSQNEVARRDPEGWLAFETGDPNFRYGGGESNQDMQNRMVSAMENVINQCVGQRVVIFSSTGSIRVYLAYILGLPLSEMPRLGLNNTGINRLRPTLVPPNKSGGRPGILLSLNDTSHLRGS